MIYFHLLEEKYNASVMKNSSQDNFGNYFHDHFCPQPGLTSIRNISISEQPNYQSPNQVYQQALQVVNNGFGRIVTPRPGGSYENQQMSSPNKTLHYSQPQSFNRETNISVPIARSYFNQSNKNFANYHDLQLKSPSVLNSSYGFNYNQDSSNKSTVLATPRQSIHCENQIYGPNSNQHNMYGRHSSFSSPIKEQLWHSPQHSISSSPDTLNLLGALQMRSSLIQHKEIQMGLSPIQQGHMQMRSPAPIQQGHMQMRSPAPIQQEQIMNSSKNIQFSNKLMSPNKNPISNSQQFNFNRQSLFQPSCKSLTIPSPNQSVPSTQNESSNSVLMHQDIFPKYSGPSQDFGTSSCTEQSNIVSFPPREIISRTIISPPCQSISHSITSVQGISLDKEFQSDNSSSNLITTNTCTRETKNIRSNLDENLEETSAPYSSSCSILENLVMPNFDSVPTPEVINCIKKDHRSNINPETATIKVGIKDCLLEGGESLIKRTTGNHITINAEAVKKTLLSNKNGYDNEIKRTSVIRKMPIPKMKLNCFVCPNCGVALDFEGALSCDRCGKSLKPKTNPVTTINKAIDVTSHTKPVKDNSISLQSVSLSKGMEANKLSSEPPSEESEREDVDQFQNSDANLDEPECLTLSSDDEEHSNCSPKSMDDLQPLRISKVDQKGGGGYKCVESSSTSVDHKILDSRSKGDSEDFVLASSRNIHIGNYTVNSTNGVKFSKNLIEFSVPAAVRSNGQGEVTLQLKSEQIVKLFYNLEGNAPVIFLYLRPTLANNIKIKLKLTESGYNLNHLSEDETVKRVILEINKISEENMEFIASSFDEDKSEALNKEQAANILSQVFPNDKKENTAETTEKTRISTQTLLVYPEPPAKGGITITTDDFYCLEKGEFLNDVILDFFLKYLINTQLSQKDRERTHVFSTFFYKRLTTKPKGKQGKHQKESLSLTDAERRHARVKSWTKNVDIFKKDFIIIPINERSHWFLAVICFPGLEHPTHVHHRQPSMSPASIKEPSVEGESKIEIPLVEDLEWSDKDEAEGDDEELDEEKEEPEPKKIRLVDSGEDESVQKKSEDTYIENPCILIFDSLSGANRSKIVATLRDYLNVEYFVKKKVRKNFSKETMKGACPKVPQQTNFSDCGIFTLQFAESFFQLPIKNFSFPIRELSNWFDQYHVSCKRELIALLIQKLMSQNRKKNNITLPKLRFNSSFELEKVESKDEPMETSKTQLTNVEEKKELANVEGKKEDKKETIIIEVTPISSNETPRKSVEPVKKNLEELSNESNDDVILDKVCSTGATFSHSKKKLTPCHIPKRRPTTPGPYKRIDEPEPTYASPLANLHRPNSNFSSQSYQTNRYNDSGRGRGYILDGGGRKKSPSGEEDVIFETEVLKPVIGDSPRNANRVEINFYESSKFKKPCGSNADTGSRSFKTYNDDRKKHQPVKRSL